MARRPRLNMSIAEMKKYVKDEKLSCLKDGCGGHVTVVALSAGWFNECYDCGATWGHTDPRGKEITKAEYEERAAQMARRQNTARTEGYSLGKDATMASKKKAKKAKTEKKAKKVSEATDTPKASKTAKRVAKPKAKQDSKTIERVYKGETLVVKILEDGFEYDGQQYKSLTAIAKVITGALAISGPRFFKMV